MIQHEPPLFYVVRNELKLPVTTYCVALEIDRFLNHHGKEQNANTISRNET